jgi:hypothetical protein
MKHLLIFASFFLLAVKARSQNVGIGTTTPATILDVKSTSQGVLIPRLTTTQMNAVATPANGLLVTNTDSANRIFIYTGVAWKGLSFTDESGSGSGVNDALLVHKAGAETITGIKTFSGDMLVNGLTIGKGKGNGDGNTTVGASSLFSNTSGGYNTAVGNSALYLNTQGVSNTANGYQALASNTTGSTNTGIGNQALGLNTVGDDNTAIGNQTLFSNISGTSNTAAGAYSLAANLSGNDNTSSGVYSLAGNLSGNGNTAAGAYSLLGNLSGNGNTAFGFESLKTNISGDQNTALGQSALSNNTTGRQNAATGNEALFSNLEGELNTVNGYRSLYFNSSGNYNVASGANAGIYASGGTVPNTVTDNSIFLGANTSAQANNQTNQIVIGYGAEGDGSNTTVLGNSSITSTKLFGKLNLQGYGAGANTGTPAYNLATDAAGNIIEVTLGAGSGGGGRITPAILTDGADVTWDIATSATTNSEITLTGVDRNLNIINPVPGEVYRIKIIQDGSGFRTIANWPANTKWEGGNAPVLTITVNSYDIVTLYFDGTNFNGSARLDYK